MAYNKASEEKKWLAWKEAEEKKMRELGVDEYLIQELHEYDWKMFKDERNYRLHIQESGSYLETLFAADDQKEIKTVEDLLDEIDNPELFSALKQLNKTTLMVAVLKMNGLSVKEIALLLELTEVAVAHRLSFIRKKLKIFSN